MLKKIRQQTPFIHVVQFAQKKLENVHLMLWSLTHGFKYSVLHCIYTSFIFCPVFT